MFWQTSKRKFDLTHRGEVMGVLNVTPDSFSDGGLHSSPDTAVAHGLEMIRQGATIIDVGGESTRPGAVRVSAVEEIDRTIPVIRELVRRTGAAISIDTSKAEVATEATRAGAEIINDVSGLTNDPAMLTVATSSQAAIVIMHMQGSPQTMQQDPHYDDVVHEVGEFFRHQMTICLESGMHLGHIAFDPGIGFGKTVAHNLCLIKHLADLHTADRPLLLGVSLKSFIGQIIGSKDLTDRKWATVGLTSYARRQGARIMRVHHVRPNVEALRMTEAFLD